MGEQEGGQPFVCTPSSEGTSTLQQAGCLPRPGLYSWASLLGLGWLGVAGSAGKGASSHRGRAWFSLPHLAQPSPALVSCQQHWCLLCRTQWPQPRFALVKEARGPLQSWRLTCLLEVHVLPTAGPHQARGGAAQGQEMLPSGQLRPGNIHLHLWIVDLVHQPIACHIWEVPVLPQRTNSGQTPGPGQGGFYRQVPILIKRKPESPFMNIY